MPPDHETEIMPPDELEERTVIVNAVNLLRMPLRISPVDTLALVDTGAVASLLSYGLFQRISRAEVEEVTPYYRQFKSAAGHPLQVQGCYRVPFEIVGYAMKHTFYVIHGLQEDCIVWIRLPDDTRPDVFWQEKNAHHGWNSSPDLLVLCSSAAHAHGVSISS